MDTIDTGSMRLISQHTVWLQRRRLAPETVRAREGGLMRFARWANNNSKTLADVDHHDVDRWQADLGLRVAAVSERNACTQLREFYRWAVREEHLQVDPTVRMILPRTPRRKPRPIHEDKLALAYQQADPRMRAIICLAAMAGLRAVEIARLSWSEVRLDGELFVAAGKGGHQRDIWIADCSPLVAALTALPHRRGPVIARLDGKNLHNTAGRISAQASSYFRDLDIPDRLHSLRHRFGTITYRAVTDPIAVMKLLGHASLAPTVIYADSADSAARTAMRAAGHLDAA